MIVHALDALGLLFRPAQRGRSIDARIAMMAMTTRSSMRVKALESDERRVTSDGDVVFISWLWFQDLSS